jgi:Sec-independent protein translocase protein TatA
MELLGIGPLEFLVILLLALIIFSPKDLAKGGKMIGRWINQVYRSDAWKSMKQVSQEMQNLPSMLAREAQLEDLKDLEKEIDLDGGPKPADLPPASPAPAAAQKPDAAGAHKLPPAQNPDAPASAPQQPPPAQNPAAEAAPPPKPPAAADSSAQGPGS